MKEVLKFVGKTMFILLVAACIFTSCGPNWQDTHVTAGELPADIVLTELSTGHTISTGNFSVTGYLHNKGTKALEPQQISAKCFDSDGKLLATPITGTMNKLAPNDSIFFQIDWIFEDKPVKVEVFVENIF